VTEVRGVVDHGDERQSSHVRRSDTCWEADPKRVNAAHDDLLVE
jgi:hypothetical protein